MSENQLSSIEPIHPPPGEVQPLQTAPEQGQRETVPWGLLDVLVVALVSFGALLFSYVIAIAIFALTSGKPLDVSQVSSNPWVVVPPQAGGYVIAVGFVALWLWLRYRVGFLTGIRWNQPSGRGVLNALGGGFALAIVFLLTSHWTDKWMPRNLPVEKLYSTTAGTYLLAAFGILIAPAVEEVFFRGLLYPALARWTGVAASVALTGGAFAMLHGPQLNWAWLPLIVIFGVGVTLTFVRARTRSVATTVLMHMAYNGTIFLLLFIQTKGFTHLQNR